MAPFPRLIRPTMPAIARTADAISLLAIGAAWAAREIS